MKHVKGLSLVELMIAVAIGTTSLLAVTSLVGYGVGVNANLLANSRLNEEINTIVHLMERDLRRTGYFANTQALITDPANVTSPFVNSIVISEHPDEAADSCILYSYDINNNGVLDTVGTNENFGFRLRSGAIEMRINGEACDSELWQDLSDEDTLQVNTLLFTENEITESGVTSTQITINIEASLLSNRNLSRQFTTDFVVRNYDY